MDSLKESKRVTLDLNAKAYAKLEEMQKATNAKSKAGMIRDAIRTYEFIVERTLAGDTILVTSKMVYLKESNS